MDNQMIIRLDKKPDFLAMDNMKTHKAIALFSGGLDSILTVKWMQKYGYAVHPIFFRAPYFKAERALQSADKNGIELEVVDISPEHIQLLSSSAYGFGRRLNPCIDCHGLMFRKAGELLAARDADYLISGEVLGQRPKSQRRDALDSVRRLSGLKDLIVRPLSQLLLPETKPVREGWIDRTHLLAINGRGRSVQHRLAQELGVMDYPSPAGGCLLTDRNYCLRLQDLIDNQELTLENLELLGNGRHFRLAKDLKLIVGRDEQDNLALENEFQNGIRLQARDYMGPLGLLVGRRPEPAELMLALQIFMSFHTKVPARAAVQMQNFIHGLPQETPWETESGKASQDVVKTYHISYN